MIKIFDTFSLPELSQIGSYSIKDVIFLLKNLSHINLEKGTEDREEAIQSGTHYSEMLPIEYKPSLEYLRLFHVSLEETAERMAIAVGVVANVLLAKRGEKLVLASLARAGTPAGILIKRYLEYKYNINLPHYSISIIRGKGIDEKAIFYILKNHPDFEIQFVDGWTGKGAITGILTAACQRFQSLYKISLNDDLAVIADPGHCSGTYGTREDFLIPSACLNSTVSGLISRTVHRSDLINENEFHGAKYYSELINEDVSNLFINTISDKFCTVNDEIDSQTTKMQKMSSPPTWSGLKSIERIQQEFGIKDINLIKPGVGETTRVLLRRVPWKILVREVDSPNLKHILLLAKERKVPIENYKNMSYECCGLIKPLGGIL
jgi:hypothetical protein